MCVSSSAADVVVHAHITTHCDDSKATPLPTHTMGGNAMIVVA
jgi:hypothetical protein